MIKCPLDGEQGSPAPIVRQGSAPTLTVRLPQLANDKTARWIQSLQNTPRGNVPVHQPVLFRFTPPEHCVCYALCKVPAL